MKNSIAIVTQSQAEHIYAELNKQQFAQAPKDIALHLASASFDISYNDAINLKSKFRQLDLEDGNLDGKLLFFSSYQNHAQQFKKYFDLSLWGTHGISLKYSEIRPHHQDEYQNTKTHLTQLYQHDQINFTLEAPLSLQALDKKDHHSQEQSLNTLVELAYHNGLFGAALMTLQEETKLFQKSFFLLVISSQYYAQNIHIDHNSPAIGYAVNLGSTPSTFYSGHQSKQITEKDSQDIAKGIIRHEHGHVLMKQFGQQYGNGSFDYALASLSSHEKLRSSLLASFEGQGLNGNKILAYESEEMCDAILIREQSETNSKRHREYVKEKVLLAMKNFRNIDQLPGLQAALKIRSNLLEGASYIQMAQFYKIAEAEEYDQLLKAAIQNYAPENFSFYEQALEWCSLVHQVALSHLVPYLKKTHPDYMKIY